MEHFVERTALMRVKECDLRADALMQCQYAVDRGIHIGGAYSAIPILTALYYGGQMRYDVENPTAEGQDIFLLSKGHAVAALAAVYADVGYIAREHLKGSRGMGSMVKGHPGPALPGVPVSTGPLGQGISVACGFALRGKENRNSDVFCLTGDGELQEGTCWEGLMYAGGARLNNLCVLIDKNNGQSDDAGKLLLSIEPLKDKLEAFGFSVYTVDGGDAGSILAAIEKFKQVPRPMGPTAIICESEKGLGGYAAVTGKHKVVLDDTAIESEYAFLARTRAQMVKNASSSSPAVIGDLAGGFGYDCIRDGDGNLADLTRRQAVVKTRRAPVRGKELAYNPGALPQIDSAKNYTAGEMLEKIAAAFAADPRFYTIDADLSNVSRLYDGTMATNRAHAINVGIAELTMMCIAEGLAAGGAHIWCSTFPPFFNLQAFRRIAVSYQEREESIREPGGWLSEGHNLDITFVGTNANLDTSVNGATHMANDDMHIFGGIAHLKMIDVSCPRQLVSIAKWIAQGNRGLVYLRTMRNPSPVLYPADFAFEYGKGYILRRGEGNCPVIVSSGHGVQEALGAAELLGQRGISVAVVDMPSFDGPLLAGFIEKKRPLLFAEQNNGYLMREFSWYALQYGISVAEGLVRGVNTLAKDGSAQFVHSGSYEELIDCFGLSAERIASMF